MNINVAKSIDLDRRLEVWQLVQRRFCLPPIESGFPVLRQPLDLGRRSAEVPLVFAVQLVRKCSKRDSLRKFGERIIRHRDCVWFNRHDRSRQVWVPWQSRTRAGNVEHTILYIVDMTVGRPFHRSSSVRGIVVGLVQCCARGIESVQSATRLCQEIDPASGTCLNRHITVREWH